MTTGKLRDFIYENYCIVNGLDLQKENLIIHGKKQKKQDLILFAIKLATKVSYPDNAKEDYQSYLKKLVTRSKIITQKSNLIENSNIDKNSNSPVYTETTKCAKIMKQSHTYKGYASTYNVNILNSLNPELQLTNTKFAIKNKFKKLTEL